MARFLLCLAVVVWPAWPQTPLSVVSAASFAREGVLAPEMIVTGFTEAITAATAQGPGAYSVVVRDSAGVE